MKRLIGITGAVLALAAVIQGRGPAGTDQATTVLRGGRLFTASHGVIERGTIVVRDGRIAAIGPDADVQAPAGARVVDLAGTVVVPGFIDAFSNLGTREIESFGREDDEVSAPVVPQLRVIDGLDPGNRFIPPARAAGVTTALSAPGEANLLSGQSAVIKLAGSTLEAMVLKSPAAVHVSLGEGPKLRWGRKSQLPSTRMGEAALLRQTLADAQDYGRRRAAGVKGGGAGGGKAAGDPVAADAKLEALLPVLDRTLPLLVSADRQGDILTALRIADEFKLRVVLSHGTEAYKVAGRLAAARVPVILGPEGARQRRLETIAARADTALVLARAGVPIAFQGGLDSSPGELLAGARAAVAHGLAPEAALRALTLSAAEILGIADRVGSLEAGKDADFVVFDADPLARLARVEGVWIGGQDVRVDRQ